MTTFDRRQRILDLLRRQPGIKVAEMAPLLHVSEGTIRNDLRALEAAGRLTRVRGGAVLQETKPCLSPAFAARLQVNGEAKQRIAGQAAELVEDGDSILLDASTTVFALVPHLLNCHNLTIITNGIEAGLALARNRSHTVILAGGVVHPGGASVAGPLGASLLETLHVKTAFVSCSGLSLEAGLTEVDINEIQLKKTMIRCAERVVALVDSTKVGKVDLTSFAGLSQIAHIITDRELDPAIRQQLARNGIALTVCAAQPPVGPVPAPDQVMHEVG
jgi:DeoR/GlpR family transcriptional regulator of sugar metabolism